MIKFRSFSSGSCGNCYFLGLFDNAGNMEASVLIDAGVSLRTVKTALLQDGIDIGDVDAMLISHDHWDHIRSIGSYCKRLSLPVWATSKLHRALAYRPGTGEYLRRTRVNMPDGWNEIVPGLVRARWFEVPHDASQTVGYAIEMGGERFVIMTDIGSMTAEALSLASDASTVVVESNYDPDMLACSPYPKELQDRISGGHGHLSNGKCAEAVCSFGHEGLRNVFLCHLSENSNTPEVALAATRPSVPDGVRLVALPRRTPSPMYIL